MTITGYPSTTLCKTFTLKKKKKIKNELRTQYNQRRRKKGKHSKGYKAGLFMK